MKKIYFVYLILGISISVFSQKAGHVDSSFATNGIEIEPAIIITDEVELAMDGNGKLIVGLNNVLATDTMVVVMRYNQNGTNDLTFHGTSASIVNLGQETYYLKDLEVLPDNKIILCGHNKNQKNNFVARLLANGEMDNTFGTNGYVILDISADSNEIALNIEPFVEGTYLVSGHAYEKDITVGYDVFLTKILNNGFIDNSFNNGEPVYYHERQGDNFNHNLLVQSDNKIVLSGSYIEMGTKFIYLRRVHPDGSEDPSLAFPSNSSIALYNFSNGERTFLKDVIRNASGGFFLAGHAEETGGTDFDVFILNANNDGSLNRDFGLENPYWATTLHDFQDFFTNDEIRKIIEMENGEIILAGFTSNLATSDLDAAIVGLSPDGSVNLDFGEYRGETVINIQGKEDRVLDAVYNSAKNKIYVAGKSWNQDESRYDLFLAAFHAQDAISSVNKTMIENKLKVFPNPATDYLHVLFKEKNNHQALVSIFNSQGIEILKKVINENNTTINVHDFPKGLYLVSVNINSEVYFGTFLK